MSSLANIKISYLFNHNSSQWAVPADDSVKFTIPTGKWLVIADLKYAYDCGNQFVYFGPVEMVTKGNGMGCQGIAIVTNNSDTQYSIRATTAFTASTCLIVGIRID